METQPKLTLETPDSIAQAEGAYREALNRVPEWKKETYRNPAEQFDRAEASRNAYKVGTIPQRLNKEAAPSVKPYSQEELSHLYELSKSSELGEQHQFNDAIRDEPVQRITQFAEYLAARDLPVPQVDRGFRGTPETYETTNKTSQPELTSAQLERIYDLGMSQSNDEVREFGAWLATFSPEQAQQFDVYKTSRLQELEKYRYPVEVNRAPEAPQVEPLAQKEGQTLTDYFREVYAAEQGDRVSNMRAHEALKGMNESDQFKYGRYAEQRNQEPGTPVETLVGMAALERSTNPEERAQYGPALAELPARDMDRLRDVRFKRFPMEKTSPKQSRWWRRLGRGKTKQKQ